MKKHALVLLVMMWLCPLLTTQAKLPPLKFEAGIGISQPLLPYASTNLNNGCFTLSGLQLAGVAATKIFNPWWLEVRFEAQLHPVDVGRLGYERVLADPFLEDTYIRSEPYRHLMVLGGPSYLLSLHKKLDFQSAIFLGIIQSKSPYQLHKPTYFLTGPDYFEITSAVDYAIAYGGELAASWKATSCYNLKLSASLIRADVDFRFQTSNGVRIDSRSINTLNLRAGVVFLIPPH